MSELDALRWDRQALLAQLRHTEAERDAAVAAMQHHRQRADALRERLNGLLDQLGQLLAETWGGAESANRYRGAA